MRLLSKIGCAIAVAEMPFVRIVLASTSLVIFTPYSFELCENGENRIDIPTLDSLARLA